MGFVIGIIVVGAALAVWGVGYEHLWGKIAVAVFLLLTLKGLKSWFRRILCIAVIAAVAATACYFMDLGPFK